MSKDSEPVTRAELAASNDRIDKLEVHIRSQSEDIAHMRGCLEGACEDVKLMKDAVVGSVTQSKGTYAELFKTLRWFIIAITIGGMVAAGWSSMSASSGTSKVEAKR